MGLTFPRQKGNSVWNGRRAFPTFSSNKLHLEAAIFSISGAVLKLFCTRKKNVITADMKLVGTLRLLKLRRVCKTLVPRLHYYYALNSFN